MEYLSFRLQIVSRSERHFEVLVWSPVGEGRGDFELDISDDDARTLSTFFLSSWLKEPPEEQPTAEAGAAQDEAQTAEESPRWRRSGDVGEWLFDLVFNGEVLELFQRSLDFAARTPDCGLRVEITYDPRDPHLDRLQSLPWELLRRPGTPEYLVLNSSSPIVRYVTLPRGADNQPTPEVLRILVVASNPLDMPFLDLAVEVQNLEKALRSYPKVELVYPKMPSLAEIRKTFESEQCHALQFMGHGDIQRKEGVLVLERDGGLPHPVRGEDLINALGDGPPPQLVVLNACRSAVSAESRPGNPLASVALSMVSAGTPAVVAMQHFISDTAAARFSEAVYDGLARGESVEAAVTEGRSEIHSVRPDRAEWATPVLFLRGRSRRAEQRERIRILMALVLALLLLALGTWLLFQQYQDARLTRLHNEGYVQFKQEDFVGARRSFEQALEIDADHAPTHSQLSLVESLAGNESAALKHAQAAVTASPYVAAYHYNLGQLLSQGRQYEAAQRALQAALDLEPQHAAALNELGRVYLALDLLPEARAILRRGITSETATAKDLAPLHKNLGFVLLVMGLEEEARFSFSDGLSYARRSRSETVAAESLLGLARAEQMADRTDAACSRLVELRQHHPEELRIGLQENQALTELATSCTDLAH